MRRFLRSLFAGSDSAESSIRLTRWSSRAANLTKTFWPIVSMAWRDNSNVDFTTPCLCGAD